MFEVLCEKCLTTHALESDRAPELCPYCRGVGCLVGPYVPESRITKPALFEVTFSPSYYTASATDTPSA
jgi:hypothetical protein